MPKMKYWNGTQWVPLDAANADTLEGLTVSQIRAGTTKADVGLGNVDNVKQASKAEFDAHVAEFNAHKSDNTPHREAVSIERKNPDDDGVFTLIEFRRSDGTLFKTSQLNGISPYTSRTVKYYDKNENLIQTVEYSITYSNDEVISEVIISA